jgi:signal transduction histidine kinase
MSDPVIQPFHHRPNANTAHHYGAEETARFKDTFSKLQESAKIINTEFISPSLSLKERVTHLDAISPPIEAVLQTMAQGVLFINLSGTISLFNEAAAKLLAVSKEQVLNEHFWTIFPDDQFGFSMREALHFGLAQRLIFKTLKTKELEISTNFVYVGPKSSHGIVILLRDLTDLQRLRSVALRNERMKELGEMAASVTHELRNPLGGIRGYASLLVRDLHEWTHLREMAGFILEGTKALESRVNAILHFARPLEPQLQTLPIGAFLKQISSFVRMDPAFPSNVRLEVHIPQEVIVAPIDSAMVKGCMLNLIYNAFQAMPQGGLLTLSLLKMDNQAHIAVSDTGIGIEEKEIAQLFSPFFTTKQNGTGLGLVEARKIARAHGGELEVRSQPRRGSTFTLILPLTRNL